MSKPRKCRVCAGPITSPRPLQSVCGHACAVAGLELRKEKAIKAAKTQERKADAVKRDQLKTRGEWMADAQKAFNLFIRLRDAGKPCICCGKASTAQQYGGVWDAGHYRSRGSAPHLRFIEDNVHAQLKQCNRYDSGNVVGYRMGLIQRIGLQAVEALEADHAPRNYTISDLRAIKSDYTERARQLKKEQS